MAIDNRLLPRTLAAQAAALPAEWAQVLAAPRVALALDGVIRHVEARLAEGATVYPATPLRALSALAPSEVRVVILGQDPYHGPGQAQGLAFSVPDDCKCPPSLRNIFKEIGRDYALSGAPGHDLGPWVEQGVLLLNTSLTVEDGQPGSHAKKAGRPSPTPSSPAWPRIRPPRPSCSGARMRRPRPPCCRPATPISCWPPITPRPCRRPGLRPHLLAADTSA